MCDSVFHKISCRLYSRTLPQSLLENVTIFEIQYIFRLGPGPNSKPFFRPSQNGTLNSQTFRKLPERIIIDCCMQPNHHLNYKLIKPTF